MAQWLFLFVFWVYEDTHKRIWTSLQTGYPGAPAECSSTPSSQAIALQRPRMIKDGHGFISGLRKNLVPGAPAVEFHLAGSMWPSIGGHSQNRTKMVKNEWPWKPQIDHRIASTYVIYPLVTFKIQTWCGTCVQCRVMGCESADWRTLHDITTNAWSKSSCWCILSLILLEVAKVQVEPLHGLGASPEKWPIAGSATGVDCRPAWNIYIYTYHIYISIYIL